MVSGRLIKLHQPIKRMIKNTNVRRLSYVGFISCMIKKNIFFLVYRTESLEFGQYRIENKKGNVYTRELGNCVNPR